MSDEWEWELEWHFTGAPEVGDYVQMRIIPCDALGRYDENTSFIHEAFVVRQKHTVFGGRDHYFMDLSPNPCPVWAGAEWRRRVLLAPATDEIVTESVVTDFVHFVDGGWIK